MRLHLIPIKEAIIKITSVGEGVENWNPWEWQWNVKMVQSLRKQLGSASKS